MAAVETGRHPDAGNRRRRGRAKHPTATATNPKEPKRLQENTIRRRCGRARQLFQAAVRHRLIARNPFAELKGVSVLANKSRDYFVTPRTWPTRCWKPARTINGSCCLP